MSRRHVELPTDEPFDHWIIYSDLMAGLVLMFILFLALSIVTYDRMLAAKATRVNNLLGVQSQIVRSLDQKFHKSNLKMHIDSKTGSIDFASDIFFAFNSYTLSPSGQQYLKAFIPQYISVLLDPRYRNDISAILVVGYTDRQGSYLYNLDLSQERALSVVNDIFSPQFGPFPYRTLLKQYITAQGRSYNDPVYIDGRYSASASRRVVFAFKLKDSQMMQAVQKTVTAP